MMACVRRGVAVACLAAVVALWACSGAADLEGRYVAPGDGVAVTLDLGPGGKGVWSTDEEQIPVTWERRGAEVWLHTKSGGMVPGRLEGDGTLIMDLPGVGLFTFVRAPR